MLIGRSGVSLRQHGGFLGGVKRLLASSQRRFGVDCGRIGASRTFHRYFRSNTITIGFS